MTSITKKIGNPVGSHFPVMRVAVICLLFLGGLTYALPADLLVMSYNILRPEWAKPSDPAWEKRVGGIAEIIAAYKPAIIGLQEEDETMVADILARLPDYAYLYPVPAKGGGMLYRSSDWMPVEYRRETTPDGRSIGEVLMRAPGGREVYFYNAHFSPFEEPMRLTSAGVLLKMIGDRPQQDVPVIVTGDLNATPDSAPLKLLTGEAKSNHLTDIFPFPVSERDRTSDAYGNNGRGGKIKIDHILFKGALKVVSAGALHDQPGGIFPSDHLPVLGVFDFPDANE